MMGIVQITLLATNITSSMPQDPKGINKDNVGEYVEALVLSKIKDNLIATKLQRLHETVVHVGQNFTLFSFISHLYHQVCSCVAGYEKITFR